MPHRHVRVVAFALLCAACGGEDDADMSVAISRDELVAGVTTVRIDVHNDDRKCLAIRDTGPQIAGIKHADVVVGAKDSGNGEITMIRPGTYTVFVWGFAGPDVPIAYGCAEDVEINSGKRTRVSLRLIPFTN